MPDDSLDVYCFGERAGILWNERPLRFEYSREWIDLQCPPLSHSLPVGRTIPEEAAEAFFGGLLPEGEPRKQIARSSGISVGNTFGLLEELGWDCAGAVSVYPSGAQPLLDGDGSDVEWLSEAELEAMLLDLPRRPLLFDGEGEVRLSLAGAQDKAPVHFDGARVGVSRRANLVDGRARTPTTHIAKTPILHLPGTVANEAFCLNLMSRVGLNSVEARAKKAGDTEFLLVTRYDRDNTESRTRRLQQEDFCQAMGVPSERKYEAEGGPTLAESFELIRSAVSTPAIATLSLLDAVGFNYLVGNHDAHGKNYSLLRSANGTVLAPFYDVLSTFVYRAENRNMTAKLAMKIGGENRWDRVEARHFDRFFKEVGLPGPGSRRRLTALAERTEKEARVLAAEAPLQAGIVDRVVELISERAQQLISAVGAQ